jgi:hypothetical protein
MPTLVNARFAEAERIRVMLDYVNTHTPAALYEAFAPPKPCGSCPSWSSITRPSMEIELSVSVLPRRCLHRRLPDQATLEQEVGAWERWRNADRARVEWRFTMADTRTKLKRVYPSQA